MQSKNPGPANVPALLKGWQAHALLAVLVLFFFRDILLRSSFFWEDFLYQYYAFRSFAAVSLAGGQLPLWNPYTFNGMPFQADIQSAIFYIPNLLLTFFAHGGRLDFWWVELSIVLHFALAGSGMCLLAEGFGVGRWYALFAGIAYCLSGFMVGHLIHQGFIYQAAWLPWIVFGFREAITRRSPAAMILTALLLGHAILAGAPQITLYIVLFLFFLFIFETAGSAKREGWRNAAPSVLIAGGIILIAVLLTAVQLLPTRELAPLSQRAEITYEKAAEGSLSFAQMITLAVPKYFGSSGAGGSNYFGPGPYWHYWETAGYIGIPALFCAIVALIFLRRKPLIVFLGFTLLFAVLYALGDNFFLHGVFHEYVPGFSNFRAPGRMLLLFTFSGSLLAAVGLQYIVGGLSGRDPGMRKIALIFIGSAAVVWVLGRSGAFITLPPGAGGEGMVRVASSESLKSSLMLFALGVAIFLGYRRTIPVAAVPVIFVTVQFVGVHGSGFDQNNGKVNPDEYYARTAGLVNMITEDGKTELFRVNSRDGGAMILDRNQGMVDRIFLMEGYTPLGLSRFLPPMSTWDRVADIMNAKYRIVVDRETGSISVRKAEGYAPRGFVVGDALVARSEEEARAALSDPGFDYMKTAVFEDPPPVILRDTATYRSTVRFDSYDLNEIRLSVETGKAGYLVLSEVYYPGWRATVDGVETDIMRCDWCLRAIPLSAGRHAVVLEFSPPSFRTGAWISLLTFGCSAAGVALLRRRRGNQHTKPEKERV